ncbi:AIPR family protein [Kocuria sp. KH4]
MDVITQSLVDEFIAEHDLNRLGKDEKFEAFTGYCVVSRQYDEEFDPGDIRVGGSNDLGIDAAALIVNGHLVTSPEEIPDLRQRNNYLQASIVLVQSKTSSGFASSVMSDFADNMCDFFSDDPQLPISEGLKNFKALLDALYANSPAFRKGRPELIYRYITTGTWTEDPHLAAKRDAAATRLESLNLFDVDFACLGAREIQDLYRQTKNSVEATFEFRDRVALPELAGVSEAYIGVAKASEYLKLITDSSGNIRKSLFYDNVRDFQDYNSVNREIRATLQDGRVRDRFVVLNNGVTIVAREIMPTSSRLTLRDYQIVNGCQTSHVLFDEREHIDEGLFVPVKVVVTQDDDVVSSITSATNRQTNVTEDDLRALDTFQKHLEDYFKAQPIEQRLYYERRSKQYSAIAVPEKTRIIAPSQLVRSYASMFLDEPWRAGRYYKELQKLRKDEIFQPGHQADPYYASAVAGYRLDFFFRNGYLDSWYRPARYQILTAIRHKVHGDGRPPSVPRKLESYCKEITTLLWDPQAGPELVSSVLPAIKAAVDVYSEDGSLNRDTVRTQQFTDKVLEGVRKLREEGAA